MCDLAREGWTRARLGDAEAISSPKRPRRVDPRTSGGRLGRRLIRAGQRVEERFAVEEVLHGGGERLVRFDDVLHRVAGAGEVLVVMLADARLEAGLEVVALVQQTSIGLPLGEEGGVPAAAGVCVTTNSPDHPFAREAEPAGRS